MTFRTRALLVTAIFFLAAAAAAETLDFRRAVQLALTHSSTMAMAAAEQQRARQGYLEARDLYIPQLVVGSGIAKTVGFPMSIEGAAPSIFNLNMQSFLLNAAQRQFVRAAKTEWQATSISSEDRRNQVILDAAMTYIQLDTVLSQQKIIADQSQASSRQEDVVRQRVQAGLDQAIDLTKARLDSARVRQRIAEIDGAAGQLRQHLSDLTGIPAQGLETNSESIPALPAATNEDPVNKALASSPTVRMADAAVLAKQQRAQGEHKQSYPAVDLVGQYGLFARFNNFDQYFLKFSRNNATFGVAIRFPFLNFSQRARAQGADAEALRAKKEAEGVRSQVSSQTLKLQGAVRQLDAAREVARLEYELARSETEAAHVRVEAGTANVKEEENTRIQEIGRYQALLDASYELQKAQLQLLQATGDLAKWATQ